MLEPFGGDVFDLAAGETTRFNAYWGAGVIVAMIATLVFTRRRRPDQQVSTTSWGLALLGLSLLLLGVVSLRGALPMVMPTLIFFGLGFGIFTVGGVSLLMAVNQESQAGTYLALWSVIQLISAGRASRPEASCATSPCRSRAALAQPMPRCSSSKRSGCSFRSGCSQRVGVAAFATKARVSTAEILARGRIAGYVSFLIASAISWSVCSLALRSSSSRRSSSARRSSCSASERA